MPRHLSPGALIAGIVGFFIGWTFGAVVGGQREFGIGFCVLFGVGYEVYRDTGGDSFLPEDRSYEEPDALQNGESASPEE